MPGDLVGEGPPAQLGLDAEHKHDVAARGRRGVRLVGGPRDAPGVPVGQVHLGPGGLEVVVLLGIDARPSARRPTARSGGGRRGWRRRRRRSSRRRPRSSSGSVSAGRRLQTTCSIARDAIGRAPITLCWRGRVRSGRCSSLRSVADAVRVRRPGPGGKPSRKGCARARSASRRPAPSGTTGRSTSRSSPSASGCRSSTTRSRPLGARARRGGTALATAVAADPVLEDRDGNPFRLSSLHGRKVLLVAWASW